MHQQTVNRQLMQVCISDKFDEQKHAAGAQADAKGNVPAAARGRVRTSKGERRAFDRFAEAS
jgi:hypothetical protein